MKFLLLTVFLGIQSVCPLSNNKKCANKIDACEAVSESPMNLGCIYLMKY